MKALAKFLIISLVVSPPAHSQQWFGEWYSQIANTDSLGNLLTVEFHKAVGSKAPTFSYRRLDDSSTHALSEDSGNVVLVNLWATDCSGCRYEMPDLSRLQTAYEERGLRVIFLSSESIEKLKQFFTVHKTAGVKGAIDRNQLQRPYQLVAKPSSFIVDRNGIVRDTWIGPKEYEDLEKRIHLCLGRAK
jgi:cytochrome c biogenesis protein CcmG, thiol:disulfide interchange protein DsbE